MALTECQKRLIEAVYKSDLHTAKKAALACVAEDTSKKNEWWCGVYQKYLSNTPTFLAVPPNLEHMLVSEDLSQTFQEDRYFLSEREQALYNHIARMRTANEELSRRNIRYMNSALLYGPSGTGKTTFGQYLAYQMKLPFVYLNFSSLVDSLMGKTSQNISRAFRFIKENACVFMIDEIDTISTRRDKAGTGPDNEMTRITVTLMQELDKLSNEHIVLAATNRIDMIDEALLRRFSKKHEVQILNETEKFQMVTKYLDAVDVSYGPENVKVYCDQNPQKPQSQIINEVNEAIVHSIAENTPFAL